MSTIPMLNKTPEFDRYYVAYVKDDPAREPIAASYSAPGVLAEAAHKTGRSKADLELQVRVAPTAQSVMCICRSRLEKFAVVSAHHRLRPFFCRAARLAKSGDECVCYLHLRESRQSASAAFHRFSMSRKACCYDNAAMESFFATLKTECFQNRIPKNRAQAQARFPTSLRRRA
jgi:hypothetical protein